MGNRLLWVIATLVTFFIKGLCGFGSTLVFTSIMGFGVANVNISPVELVLGYPPNVIMVWKNRKLIKPKLTVPLLVLVLAGSIPGALLLKNVDVSSLKVVFGIVVVLIGIEMIFREYGKGIIRESKAVMLIVGLLSGILCGLFGIGALIAAYMGCATKSGDEFKANVCTVFLVENTVRIVIYSIIGVITPDAVKQAALLVPLMLIGLWAGMKSAQVLNEKVVKKLVIIMLIISGAALVVMNLKA